MGSKPKRRRKPRTRSIESLEERQVMSADPVTQLLGGSISQDALTDQPLEHHAGSAEVPIEQPGMLDADVQQLGSSISEPPAPEHHSQLAADFWLDPSAERDLEWMLGDIEQTLASAHNASGLTQVRNNYGFIGTGQTVAVIDSGIAWDHYALGGGLGANYRVVGGWDFTENDANPYDDGPDGSHGTHVAGIVGSDRSGTSDDGVAPGVDLVGLRVFNDMGDGYFSWVESALQWVHQNRNGYENPITAVNLSIGTTWNSNSVPLWSTLEDEFAQLKADGIFVTVSAGNSFANYNTPGLSYPAASPYVVPVMAVDDGGNLSHFSQRHPRAIAAPGRFIVSTIPDYTGNHNGVADDFASYSGTSMAAPYVAGASVLLREAMQFVGYANITQDTIFDHMMATADSFFDAATNQTYKRLNLASAFSALMPTDDFGSTSGNASNLGTLSSQQSIAGLIGTLNDKDFFTFTAGATGTVNLSIAGTHSLEPIVSVIGSSAVRDGDTWTFDVVAGGTYTFSLETTSGHGIGYYDADLELEQSIQDPVMTVKTVVRSDGVVFSLDSENWLSVDGYRLWEDTCDFALGADGTVYWQSVDGTLAHRLTTGAWVVISYDTTKFAVQNDGTVLSLDSQNWVSVDGYKTWDGSYDFALKDSGEIYWQGTNHSFARRDIDRLWHTLDLDITKFEIQNDGVVLSLDSEGWVSMDGYRVWGITQDFYSAPDGTIYWQGNNSSLARRPAGGSWETLSLDTVKFAVRHDGAVYTLSRNGDVNMDGVRIWSNVTDILTNEIGRLVVQFANGDVREASGKFYASRQATLASNAVGAVSEASSVAAKSKNVTGSIEIASVNVLPGIGEGYFGETVTERQNYPHAFSAMVGTDLIRLTFTRNESDVLVNEVTSHVAVPEENADNGKWRWESSLLEVAAERHFADADIDAVVGHSLGAEDAPDAVDSVYERIGESA